MFLVKSQNVPINTLGVEEKRKRIQMIIYLGFLRFFFATQFQPDRSMIIGGIVFARQQGNLPYKSVFLNTDRDKIESQS